jgi:hypothetical protein
MARILGLAILLAGSVLSLRAAPVDFTIVFTPHIIDLGFGPIDDFISDGHSTVAPTAPPYFSSLTLEDRIDFSLPSDTHHPDANTKLHFTYMPSNSAPPIPAASFTVTYAHDVGLPNGAGFGDEISVDTNYLSANFQFDVFFPVGFMGNGQALFSGVSFGSDNEPTVAIPVYSENGHPTEYFFDAAVSTSAVPEPSAILLMAGGLIIVSSLGIRTATRSRACPCHKPKPKTHIVAQPLMAAAPGLFPAPADAPRPGRLAGILFQPNIRLFFLNARPHSGIGLPNHYR